MAISCAFGTPNSLRERTMMPLSSLQGSHVGERSEEREGAVARATYKREAWREKVLPLELARAASTRPRAKQVPPGAQ